MAERVGRLLSCGHDGFALRNVAQQFRDVCWGDNFEEFVGSISLQSSYGAGRVVDGDAFLREEVHERLLLKALVGDIDKGVLVVVKQEAEDAPHVVLEVGIEKIDGPPLLRRGKTSEHKHFGLFGQKRSQRMVLHGRFWCW